MITPDANIILYAYNEDAPQHSAAKMWLEEQFSLPDVFGLSWQRITAFLKMRDQSASVFAAVQFAGSD